ncbi:hypothetical protein Cgig2_033707 [Carnegiea gigantea]|uniref:Uncharacterized protein n=1 Tax=Carnegiea gigantea TaxID=171969 RepID=A0A9Q1K6W3_9CARY|nr:hypothetical protein Cgig2_033707 [Carnegiea gigantea]
MIYYPYLQGLYCRKIEIKHRDFLLGMHSKKDCIKASERRTDFYNPSEEDDLEQSTLVTIMYELKPKLEEGQEEEQGKPPPPPEFTDKLAEEEALPADQKDDFKARETRKKAVEEMSAEKKAELKNIKFYKFYPVATPDTPDISRVKSSFINRYYRKAHKFSEVPTFAKIGYKNPSA